MQYLLMWWQVDGGNGSMTSDDFTDSGGLDESARARHARERLAHKMEVTMEQMRSEQTKKEGRWCARVTLPQLCVITRDASV